MSAHPSADGRAAVSPDTAATRLGVKPLHATLGAEIRKLDLSATLADTTFEQVRAAFEHYGLLVFRGQTLTEAQQLDFSRRFGALEAFPEDQQVQRERPEFYHVSNVDAAGRLAGAGSVQVRLLQFNALWHTDSSYRTIPSLASVLYAEEVPDEREAGGQTEYADMLAAYDELPEELRRRM